MGAKPRAKCERVYARPESEVVSDVLGRLSSAWDILVLNRDDAPLSIDAQECARHLRNVFGVLDE